jgi:phosphatidylglycerol:prolipoprotein diacylglycerol transferase
MYLVLAGGERFFIEFFRAKDDRFAMGLTLAQIIAITLAIVGVLVMQARRQAGTANPRPATA